MKNQVLLFNLHTNQLEKQKGKQAELKQLLRENQSESRVESQQEKGFFQDTLMRWK